MLEKSSRQAMHSRIGPWEEAKVLYVAQSGLAARLAASPALGPVVLHDVGMGISANALAALDTLETLESGVPRSLEIHSFENDLTGLLTALDHSEKFPFLQNRQTLLRRLIETGSVEVPNLSWKLHEGDYFENLMNSPVPELIYYDFYAPRIYPALWTTDRFQEIHAQVTRNRSPCTPSEQTPDHGTELYTYTASTAVRAALLAAGFHVGYGTSTALKRETTIASTRLSSLQNPLEGKWLQKLMRSQPAMDVFTPEDWKILRTQAAENRQFKS